MNPALLGWVQFLVVEEGAWRCADLSTEPSHVVQHLIAQLEQSNTGSLPAEIAAEIRQVIRNDGMKAQLVNRCKSWRMTVVGYLESGSLVGSAYSRAGPLRIRRWALIKSDEQRSKGRLCRVEKSGITPTF